MAVIGKQRVTSLVTAVGLTIPAGTKGAMIEASGNNVRYWLNGDTPTASEGHFIGNAGVVFIDRIDGLDTALFIETAATAALEVTYYNHRALEVRR